MAEKKIEQKIIKDLRKSGFEVEVRPTLQGVRPDLLVRTPDNRRFVVEVKAWESRPGFAARAANQAKHYAEILDADGSFVVLDQLKKNYGAGVVTPEGLMPAVERWLAGSAPKKKSKPLEPAERTTKTFFVAMPFSDEYDDTYFALADAAKEVGAACKRVDQEDFAGDIGAEVKRLIQASRAVIADVSEARPDVLYEIGLAEGWKKPVLQICSTPIKKLPFSIRQNNTIIYRKGQTRALARRMKPRLEPFV